MFDKMLASLGIGSAKVDTRLAKSTYRQGEMIKGDIYVQGGKSTQKIDSIYMYLILQNYIDEQSDEYVLDEFLLTDTFHIQANESKVIPFEFQLPYDTPVTTGGAPIYLKTGLDIDMAVDPDDLDGFEVLPHPIVDRILQSIEMIGFQLSSVEFDHETFHERHPFVQKYRLIPQWEYQNVLDEVKMVFYPSVHEVDVILQVNSKPVGLKSQVKEALNIDEKFVRFTISETEEDCRAVIEKHLRDCMG